MPLQHFRKRKQLIYWIISICIIPAFVLLWGTGRAFRGPARANPKFALIGDQTFTRNDFYDFQSPGGSGRLPAALGTRGVRIRYSPATINILARNFKPKNADDYRVLDAHISTAIVLAILEQAKKAGLNASLMEVSAYIHRHPFFAGIGDNEARFAKAYRERIKQMRLTNKDFIRGVREWLIIRKFITLMDRSIPASPDDAYMLYARDNTKCTYSRLVVRITQQMRKDAIDKVSGKTRKHPGPDEALTNAAVEKYLAEHPKDRELWTKAKWRFEWVLAPFDAIPVEVTAANVENYYNSHKWDFKGKQLDEVYDKVQEQVKKNKQKEMALRTLRGEFMSYLRQHLASKKPIRIEDIGNDPGLRKRGVVAGVSGPKAVSTDGIRLNQDIGDCQELAQYLDQLDTISDSKTRDKEIEKLRKLFDDRPEPFACKKGLFRIRLLEYQASQPRNLYDEKGKLDAQLRILVVDKLQQREAESMARKLAEEYAAKIQAGDTGKIKAMKIETKDYKKLRQTLRDAPLNTPQIFPLYGDGQVTGFEVMTIVKRTPPARSAFAALPADKRKRYEQMAAWQWHGYIQRYDWQRRGLSTINPGPVLQQWIEDETKSGRIKLLDYQ